MSRIGKKTIVIPAPLKVAAQDGRVRAEGPTKGKTAFAMEPRQAASATRRLGRMAVMAFIVMSAWLGVHANAENFHEQDPFDFFTNRSSQLVGWWPLDGASNAWVWDRRENRFNGRLNHFHSSPFVPGVVSNALSFSSRSVVNITNLQLDLKKGFALSVLVLGTNADQRTRLAQGNDLHGNSWELGIGAGGTAHMWFMDSVSRTQTVAGAAGTLNLRDNQWHHVLGMYDADTSNATIVVDGMAEAGLAIINWSSSGMESLVLGHSTNATFALDDVRLYNAPLASNAISRLLDIYVSASERDHHGGSMQEQSGGDSWPSNSTASSNCGCGSSTNQSVGNSPGVLTSSPSSSDGCGANTVDVSGSYFKCTSSGAMIGTPSATFVGNGSVFTIINATGCMDHGGSPNNKEDPYHNFCSGSTASDGNGLNIFVGDTATVALLLTSTNSFTTTNGQEYRFGATDSFCGQDNSGSWTINYNMEVLPVSSMEFIEVDPGDGQVNLFNDNPPTHGGGDRFFAEQNSSGGLLHNKVKARATLSAAVPSGSTAKYYFKVLDMDDPTQNGAGNVVDSTDTSTEFNGNDNRDPSVPGGMGMGIMPTNIVAVTVASGGTYAEVEYTLTARQPGNNYKVVVCCSSNRAADVVVDSTDGLSLKHQSAGDAVPSKNQTHLLTVWRKLHVEVDSMAAVPAFTNTVSGQVTDIVGTLASGAIRVNLDVNLRTGLGDNSTNLDPDPSGNVGNGRFENGRILIGQAPSSATTTNLLGNGDAYVATQPGQSFNIPFSMQNGAFSASGMVFSQNNGVIGVNSGSVLLPGAFAGGTITVGGVTTNVVNNIGNYVIAEGNINLPMTLADDDVNALLPSFSNTGLLADALAEAYVLPIITQDGNGVAFKVNIGGDDNDIIAAQQWNTRNDNANDFWVAYLLEAFQGNVLADHDPNAEARTFGITPSAGHGGSLIFREIHQSHEGITNPTLEEQVTAVHELGHPVGGSGAEPVTDCDTPNTCPGVVHYTPGYIRSIRSSARPEN